MARSFIDRFAREALDWIVAARCHWCAAPTAGAPCCDACGNALPWNEPACPICAGPVAATAAGRCLQCREHAPPQDCTWTAFRYEPPVTGAVVALKFHARLAPAHVLGWLMAMRLARRPEPLPELLIPVPLHASRLRRRGYNQAHELGRELARHLPLHVRNAARRVRATAEQTRLDAGARRRNVRGAFTVSPQVHGRHLALLDDVITTGATAAELARAARAAGAARIEVWAVARAT